jgi:hypothetical protein
MINYLQRDIGFLEHVMLEYFSDSDLCALIRACHLFNKVWTLSSQQG